MKATDFYQYFEDSFNAQMLPPALKKMAGKTPKWKIQIDGGALEFKLSTNFKGAGLLDHLLWPGEHRMTVNWITGRGKERNQIYVSLFQYTNQYEVSNFTEIMRYALKKYLDAHGQDPLGILREYLTSDLAVPKPNIDTFYYYFDADDAQRWGEWYGAILDSWINRFLEKPESNDDWAWRVLWPHLERSKPSLG
jgi:hypothetical protein